MICKTIEIDGKPVQFRASATIPRLYRLKFGRDVLADMNNLCEAYVKNQQEGKSFPVESLEAFENVAYIMAKHAKPNEVSNSPEEWLEQFGVLSIYEVLPDIFDLWGLNIQTTVECKKKLKTATDR